MKHRTLGAAANPVVALSILPDDLARLRLVSPQQRDLLHRLLNLPPSGALGAPNVWQMFGNVAPHRTGLHSIAQVSSRDARNGVVR